MWIMNEWDNLFIYLFVFFFSFFNLPYHLTIVHQMARVDHLQSTKMIMLKRWLFVRTFFKFKFCKENKDSLIKIFEFFYKNSEYRFSHLYFRYFCNQKWVIYYDNLQKLRKLITTYYLTIFYLNCIILFSCNIALQIIHIDLIQFQQFLDYFIPLS